KKKLIYGIQCIKMSKLSKFQEEHAIINVLMMPSLKDLYDKAFQRSPGTFINISGHYVSFGEYYAIKADMQKFEQYKDDSAKKIFAEVRKRFEFFIDEKTQQADDFRNLICFFESILEDNLPDAESFWDELLETVKDE